MDTDSKFPERKTKQKRDPAWNYCEMYKNGNKNELKCVFCGKVFKGGGIHRVKEHLAGAKGDGGSPCLKVDPDVRTAMQENLTGLVGRKRKKQRFVDAELLNQNDGNVEDDSFPHSYDLNTVGELIRLTDSLQENPNKRVNTDRARKEVNVGEREIITSIQGALCEVEDVVTLEPVAIGSFKRDAAWKYCQMYKNGGKTILKCIYCGKFFNGGGIYRLKEHLAGRVGNGSVCSKVQDDVRLLMQERLRASGSVGQKGKKQKPFIEKPDPANDEVDSQSSGHDLNNDIDLFGTTGKDEQSSDKFVNGEDQDNGGDGRVDKRHTGKAYTSRNPHKPLRLIEDGYTAIDSRSSVDNLVQMAIGHFLLYAGIPFDAINSVYFQRMIDAISSQGSHVVIPSCNDLRSQILKNAMKEVKSDIEKFTGCWARSGCSILVDEWITEKGRTLLNILVNCPEGNLFLKSMDISAVRDSADAVYQLLSNVIEEVGVDNVLQVVTSGEERYIATGKRLTSSYPSVFWTPCASHCLSLMLEDFRRLQWISAMLEQCQSMTRFIYNNNVILNVMRRHTFGVDLVDIGVTQSATDFMTLNRMMSVKQNLQTMVTSDDWAGSSYARKPEGLAVRDCFSSESFWSTCALIARLTDPLLRLLRIVGREKRPAMGYVCAGLYKAKETIKKELVDQKDYFVYWDIIDQRWQHLQLHPLLAAGFYLNPKFFYSTGVDVHHLKSLLYDCVEKLVPDPSIQDKIVKETISYQNAVGDFGRKMAVRARDSLLPAEWWSTYGGASPNLARFAVRILSQTCSLMGSKPSHIRFEEMHETKNCLEQQRLDDLVSVQYNLWLRERASKNKDQEPLDPLMYTNDKVIKHWVMNDETRLKSPNVSDWSTVSPPTGSIMLLGSQADDYEALGAGFDDFEVFNSAKESEATT